VPSGRILRLIQENAGDGDRIVRALIAEASQSSKDNISVVWVEGAKFAPRRRIEEDAERTAPLGRCAARHWIYLAAGAALGIAAGVAGTWGWLNRTAPVEPPRTLVVSSDGIPTISEALERARPGIASRSRRAAIASASA
jgi:hypothetical protein